MTLLTFCYCTFPADMSFKAMLAKAAGKMPSHPQRNREGAPVGTLPEKKAQVDSKQSNLGTPAIKPSTLTNVGSTLPKAQNAVMRTTPRKKSEASVPNETERLVSPRRPMPISGSFAKASQHARPAPISSPGASSSPPRSSKYEKRKRSFLEIMEEAQQVKPDCVRLPLITKRSAPSASRAAQRLAELKRRNTQTEASVNISSSRKMEKEKKTTTRIPAPAAQPSTALKKRLLVKHNKSATVHRADVSDDDDFVVKDTEDSSCDDGFNYRDEIWRLLRRGGRAGIRDDEDSDTMEATADDVLAEERSSLRFARLEDEREDRRLKELALRKQQRRSHM